MRSQACARPSPTAKPCRCYIAPQAFAESRHDAGRLRGLPLADRHGHARQARQRAEAGQQAQPRRGVHGDLPRLPPEDHEEVRRQRALGARQDRRAKAPLCADCHNPHATKSTKEANAADDALCRQCHEKVTQAFTASVHGTDGENLECKDCHLHARREGGHRRRPPARPVPVVPQGNGHHARQLVAQRGPAPGGRVSAPPATRRNATRRVDLRIHEARGEKAAEKVGVPQFVAVHQQRVRQGRPGRPGPLEPAAGPEPRQRRRRAAPSCGGGSRCRPASRRTRWPPRARR
jgi:predicted CXXCH cytochrome family protein